MQLLDTVYAKLQKEIFQAKYKPNELISERQIAEKYGVSKLTARGALHRLCAEGHITSYPRSGYMVTVLTPEDMRQLKRVRIAVETLILEIICEEVDADAVQMLKRRVSGQFSETDSASQTNSNFHLELARLAGDRYALRIVEMLLGSASRVEQTVTPPYRETWQGYHSKIIDALVARDCDAAKKWLVLDINQR